MAFDVGRVRAAYPALADGYAYLDGAAGTQVPAAVIKAISDAYLAGLGNALGIRDNGSAVRASLVHYNDEADVTRLLEAVAELANLR